MVRRCKTCLQLTRATHSTTKYSRVQSVPRRLPTLGAPAHSPCAARLFCVIPLVLRDVAAPNAWTLLLLRFPLCDPPCPHPAISRLAGRSSLNIDSTPSSGHRPRHHPVPSRAPASSPGRDEKQEQVESNSLGENKMHVPGSFCGDDGL